MENTILIIDDDKNVIEHISILLKSFGYKPDFITRPELVMKRLEYKLVDLILLDINMPGIDGITLLKELKEDTRFKDVPVIMLTADTDNETLEKSFKAGADDYITKPVSELVLKSRVKSGIDRYKNLQKIKMQVEEIKAQKDEVIKQKNLVEIINKTLTDSLKYANIIQNGILKEKDLLNEYIDDSFILFKPKGIVSGDFYWFSNNKKKLFVAAVDCTGHGVPGALLSMVGSQLLNRFIKIEGEESPAAILGKMDNGIRSSLDQKNNDSDDGMDIGICVIDLEKKQMVFAGAGSSMIYITNEELEVSKGSPYSVGGAIFESTKDKYTEHTINYEGAFQFYLFSDGYMDQFGGDNMEKFGKRRFEEMLMKNHNLPMGEQEHQLDSRLIEWVGRNGQIDDILVIGCELNHK